jgi:pimeloyl-ACP methyl ester carboxylesterase
MVRYENYEEDTTRTVWMKADDPLVTETHVRVVSYFEASEKLSANPDRVPEIRKKLEYMWSDYPNFTPEQLKMIKTPTLVMAGDHDLISDELTLSLYEALPHAQLCILPGTTHTLLWEIPELANQTILNFLKTPCRDIDRLYFFR